MNNFSEFECIAFPWRIYDSFGQLIVQGDGALFDEVSPSPSSVSHYSNIRKGGWSLCPAGYGVYSREVNIVRDGFHENAILVIGGLKIHGYSTVSGRSDAFSVKTTREIIQDHVEYILHRNRNLGDVSVELSKKFDEITRQNVHELRGINGAILHAAEELHGLFSGSTKRQKDIAGNIVALTQILSSRMDLISYLSSGGGSQSLGNVPVYQRFDKMCRSFKPQAARKKVEIHLDGTCRACVYGPKLIFELIPYLILDNAIKYSPDGRKVNVEVNQYEGEIEATVKSTGPMIDSDEIELIFLNGYRGRNALASNVSGTGIGLSVLKKMIEVEYGGEISVSCGKSRETVKGSPYSTIEFKCVFPISLE